MSNSMECSMNMRGSIDMKKNKDPEKLRGHSSIDEVANPRAKAMIIQLILFVLLYYVVISLVFSYLHNSLAYLGDIKNPGKYFRFKLIYLVYAEGLGVFWNFMISALLSIFTVVKLDQLWKVKNGNKGVKGKAHWLKEEEVENLLSSFPEDNIEECPSGGIPLWRNNGYIYVDTETIHSLIIGTTRSGKGQTFVMPMIRYISHAKIKHSMILNDPKGELLENCYDMLIKNGYNVAVLNLRDTQWSHLWNPLQVIIDEYRDRRDGKDGNTDLSRCIKLSQSLANVFTHNDKSDPIWPDSAKSLFVAMLLYLLEQGYDNHHLENVSLYSLYQMFIEFGTANEIRGQHEINALDELFESLPIGNPAKSAYATSNFASGEMRSSIFSTLASNLTLFGSDVGVSKLTSGNQINFQSLADPDKPMAVFMLVPDNETSRYVLASLFVNQCYDELVEYANNFRGQKLPQRVHFILDEFGNMVHIPNMDTKITVGAGRNLLFNMFIQDLNQLDTKYSNAAKTIRSNCGNLVYINSLDNDTNKYFSEVLGNKTLEYSTYSGSLSSFLDHQNKAVEAQALVTADELANLPQGTAITKRQRSYPMKTKFEFFYKLGIKAQAVPDIAKKMQLIDRPLEETIYPLEEIWCKLIRRTIIDPSMPAQQDYKWKNAAERLLSDNRWVWQAEQADENGSQSFRLVPKSGVVIKRTKRTDFKPQTRPNKKLDDVLSRIKEKNEADLQSLMQGLNQLFGTDLDTDGKKSLAKKLIDQVRKMSYLSGTDKRLLEDHINTAHNGAA